MIRSPREQRDKFEKNLVIEEINGVPHWIWTGRVNRGTYHTPDWSKGTRELMPVFIVGDQAERERLLAEYNQYLDGLRSQLTDDERNDEELEGDDEE